MHWGHCSWPYTWAKKASKDDNFHCLQSVSSGSEKLFVLTSFPTFTKFHLVCTLATSCERATQCLSLPLLPSHVSECKQKVR